MKSFAKNVKRFWSENTRTHTHTGTYHRKTSEM